MRIDAHSPINALTAGALSQAARAGDVQPVSAVERDDNQKARPETKADPYIDNSNRLADGANLIAAQEAKNGENNPEQQGQQRSAQGQHELTEEEEQIVAELKKRDQEVRQHERAHAAAGGGLTGAPSYSYTRGPDGKQYAVSGEVSIDVSPAATPEATIRKMETVIKAANAPAEPSSQDRAVANQAKQEIISAKQEIQEEKAEEAERAKERKQEKEAEQTGQQGHDPFALTAQVTTAIQSYQATVSAIQGLGSGTNNRFPALVA